MTGGAAAMLEVESLAKLYTTREGIAGGVEQATFAVPQGAFFTLFGPSGCGKTTTLRCIAGLGPDRLVPAGSANSPKSTT